MANSPYSQNLKTNIGKLLINLGKKQFLKNNKSHKMFNLNALKLSYCSGAQAGTFRGRRDILKKRHFDKRFMYYIIKKSYTEKYFRAFFQDTLNTALSMMFNP